MAESPRFASLRVHPRFRAWHLVLGALFVYTGVCVWSAFRGGVFAFHDLALLNDLFSNAVHRGRPFWVTDADLNHLTVHFTPTLLLLTPLFLLSDSQFLFTLLGWVALYAAVGLQVWFFERMVEEHELLPAVWRPWVSVAFTLYLALNPFVKTVALSAHFEVFFQLGSTAVLVMLLRGTRMRWVVLTALLTLGVRPDGGLFLAFQSAALLLLPAVARPPRAVLTRRALGVSALALGFLALCVAVVLPALGTPSGTRFWSHYGSTWGQVAFTALGDPGRVVHDVATSGLVVARSSVRGHAPPGSGLTRGVARHASGGFPVRRGGGPGAGPPLRAEGCARLRFVTRWTEGAHPRSNHGRHDPRRSAENLGGLGAGAVRGAVPRGRPEDGGGLPGRGRPRPRPS